MEVLFYMTIWFIVMYLIDFIIKNYIIGRITQEDIQGMMYIFHKNIKYTFENFPVNRDINKKKWGDIVLIEVFILFFVLFVECLNKESKSSLKFMKIITNLYANKYFNFLSEAKKDFIFNVLIIKRIDSCDYKIFDKFPFATEGDIFYNLFYDNFISNSISTFKTFVIPSEEEISVILDMESRLNHNLYSLRHLIEPKNIESAFIFNQSKKFVIEVVNFLQRNNI